MHGDEAVIELLNEVLTAELTSTNQYFLDAKMLDHWGYGSLGEHFRHESISEMKDADALIERILYLEGHPNLQRLGAVRTGESTQEKLQLALDLERDAINRLNRGIPLCAEKGDYGSRALLEHILRGEEAHADWLETQLAVIGQIGEALYLSEHIRS